MNPIMQSALSALVLGLAGAGCISTQDPDNPPATQEDIAYLREEIRRLNSRIEASAAELGRVQGDVMSSRASQPDYASAAQVQSLQTQLDGLQGQIRTLDAARAQDKKEIYDDISKKIATLLKPAASASTRAPRRTGSETGYEHVVQLGESLSKIAAAYGVKVSAIVEANGLESPDNIRVGQKLFIPD